MSQRYAPGIRVEIRDAEWRIKCIDYTSDGGELLTCEGLSELVRGREATFLTNIEPNILILAPEDTKLVDDISSSYRASRLYLATLIRQASPVMAALNQAIADRNNPKDEIHHSDSGVQYLSIRYNNKMVESNVIAFVGTTGYSYENTLAETVNGLYKTGVIYYLKDSQNGINDFEMATLEWLDWFNKTRLHSTIGYVSPFEFEKPYYNNFNLLGEAA